VSSGPASGGTITGSVIDAATAAPIAHANVTLTTIDGFGLLSDPRGSLSPLAIARTVTTSATGVYRLTDVPIGTYRLYVQRIGYSPTTLEVRLEGTGTSSLSIGLVVLPVRLRPVEVRAPDGGAASDNRSAATIDDERVAAVRARQQAFLSTDARELTTADVTESATLGGRDVLRSLQRLPGVTQLDDWSAKLWVRGNRWDHNRIYYDDLPLFDPLQALGQTSGVSADAIGAAFLHPGVRPTSLGGEGATRIDLRSRSAGGAGDWQGVAQLSPFGASAALDHERSDGSAGFALTAAHTLGEWLPNGAIRFNALGDRLISDAQLTARGDLDLGDGRRLETSGLLSRDVRRFHSESGYEPGQDWGNVVARLTFRAPVGSLATSTTVGASHFASGSNRWIAQASPDTGFVVSAVQIEPVMSTVDYLTLVGRIGPMSSSRSVSTAGYDLILQRSSFAGPRLSIYWGDFSIDQTSRRDALAYGSLWGERRMELGGRLSIETGVRVDVGGSGLDALRPAGSAQARFAASPRTWLSIGASRAHQYVQRIDLPTAAQGATAPGLWLTSGADVPMMSVDNAMAGLERWVGSGVLLSANAYTRQTTDIITDDPTSGPLVQRPLFVSANESAHGIELSGRKITGRTTALLGYSYARATMHAQGQTFTAPASRTHALDAASTVRFGSLDVTGAYTLTSGAPFTRTVFDPSKKAFERDAPYAQRLPAYSSLDLSVDYSRRVRGASLSVFAGVQNVLGRMNPTWYQTSGCFDNGQGQPTAAPQCRDHDMLAAPVKFAPTAGLRLVF
jgi:hypothetical protein